MVSPGAVRPHPLPIVTPLISSVNDWPVCPKFGAVWSTNSQNKWHMLEPSEKRAENLLKASPWLEAAESRKSTASQIQDSRYAQIGDIEKLQ